MSVLVFTVPGAVRGKGRPRFARIGKYTRTYTDTATVGYENKVMLCFREAYPGWKPTPCPVRMRIYESRVYPGSWSKRKRAQMPHPQSKPDLDNVVKIVGDALNKVAFLDDKQIYCEYAQKHWGDAEGLKVVIEVEDTNQKGEMGNESQTLAKIDGMEATNETL